MLLEEQFCVHVMFHVLGLTLFPYTSLVLVVFLCFIW